MRYRYYQTDHALSQQMGKYIKEGFDAQILPVFADAPGGTAMMYGVLRGTFEVMQRCENNSEDYIYIDHAYFFKNRGRIDSPAPTTYFRMVRNGRYWNSIPSASHKRFDKLDIDIKPFHKSGDKIVVVPLSRFIAACMKVDSHKWMDQIIREIVQYTARDIVIKPKSEGDIEGLNELFTQAWAVVTAESLSALSAIANGVPVFCSDQNPVAKLGYDLTELDRLDDPRYPTLDEIRQHFADLADQQFTVIEITNGTARSMLELQNAQ